jgi:hypothetical protein
MFYIRFSRLAEAKAIETGLQVGPRRVVTLTLQTQDVLTYSFDFWGGRSMSHERRKR